MTTDREAELRGSQAGRRSQRSLALINQQALSEIDKGLRDPIHYRKSGLSINHIIGCPIDCAYCIRHDNDNFDMKAPQLIMSDEEVVEQLLQHPYFVPGVTPLQLLNKATDPFLSSVKNHTFRTLRLLAEEGLSNHVLVITRWRVTTDDCEQLNALGNLRVTLLVTCSGIDESRSEPIPNKIPTESLATAFATPTNIELFCTGDHSYLA